METKTCTRQYSDQCYGTASIDLFVRDKKKICLNCRKEQNKRFYATNKERLNLQERARVKFNQNYQPMSFANGVIYKLVNSIDDKIYVGSTCDAHKRLTQHKSVSNKETEQLVYKHFNGIGWNNVSMIIGEAYPCESKCELEMRERYWIAKLNPSLNTERRPRISTDERKHYRAIYAKWLKMKEIVQKYKNVAPVKIVQWTLE